MYHVLCYSEITNVLNFFIQNKFALFLIFQFLLQEGKSLNWDLNAPFSKTLRSPVVSLSKNDVSLWIFNLGI